MVCFRAKGSGCSVCGRLRLSRFGGCLSRKCLTGRRLGWGAYGIALAGGWGGGPAAQAARRGCG